MTAAWDADRDLESIIGYGTEVQELLADLLELRKNRPRGWLSRREEALSATYELIEAIEAAFGEERGKNSFQMSEERANGTARNAGEGVTVSEYKQILEMIEAQQAKMDELLTERAQSYSELRSMIENFRQLQTYTSAQYEQLRFQFEKMIAEKNEHIKSLKQQVHATRPPSGGCAPCAPTEAPALTLASLFSCFSFLGPQEPAGEAPRPADARERPAALQLVGVDRARAVAAMDALIASPRRSEREVHSSLCTCSGCMSDVRGPGRPAAPPVLPVGHAPAKGSAAGAESPPVRPVTLLAPPVLPRLFALPGDLPRGPSPPRRAPEPPPAPLPAPEPAASPPAEFASPSIASPPPPPPPAPTSPLPDGARTAPDAAARSDGDRSSDSLEGVDPYFTKPLDVGLLLTKLQRLSSASPSASPPGEAEPEAAARPRSGGDGPPGPPAPAARPRKNSQGSAGSFPQAHPPRKRVPAGGHRLKPPVAAGGHERPRVRPGVGALPPGEDIGTQFQAAAAAVAREVAAAGADGGAAAPSDRGKFVVTL